MTVCHREFEMTVCHGEFERTICHQICSSNFISLAWKAKKLGKTCTVRLPVRPLWTLLCALLCRALPVSPLLSNPMRNPLFWPLFHLGLFEIDLGYWSSKLKISLGYWSSAFFGHFFQQARREGSDQNFFLPRVPKFKLDQTGWPHDLSFYTPFTQAREITVKDHTIVTGPPV